MQDALFMSAKLVVASVLGGIVGYEREVHEHPAGLRTHILVCMGAALITLVSVSFGTGMNDPGRIAAQIVSGIGFLGAGTILRQGNIVRGLTTAASLWTVAGIGMAVAVGGVFLVLALVATLIVFLTLSTMRSFEPVLGAKRAMHSLKVEMGAQELQVLGDLLQKLTSLGVQVHSIRSLEPPAEGKRAFKLRLLLPPRVRREAVAEALADEEGLDRFEWT